MKALVLINQSEPLNKHVLDSIEFFQQNGFTPTLCYIGFPDETLLPYYPGVETIQILSSQNPYPEELVRGIMLLQKSNNFQIIGFMDTDCGNHLGKLLASKYRTIFLSRIENVELNENGIGYTRRVAASYQYMDGIVDKKLIVCTFIPPASEISVELLTYRVVNNIHTTKGTEDYLLLSAKQDGGEEKKLINSDIVIIAGKGCSKETYDKLLNIANIIGAEVGITRSLAYSGIGNSRQIVGQSGVRIAPELLLTFGVSGAAAFVVGIEGSKTVLSVNSDPNAPIFKHSDYGIVDSTAPFVEKIEELLKGGVE